MTRFIDFKQQAKDPDDGLVTFIIGKWSGKEKGLYLERMEIERKKSEERSKKRAEEVLSCDLANFRI